MTARVQHQRFSATTQIPGALSRATGEMWVNYPDLRMGVIDNSKTAQDLLAIRRYATTSTYLGGDFMVMGGQIYRAKALTPPHAFAPNEWDQVQTLPDADGRYLRLTGGTVTGPSTFTQGITLGADATLPMQVPTKQQLDNRVARSGDTMTGYLTLAADPAAPMHAATAQYVTNSINGSNLFLRLTGGNLSGSLYAAGEIAAAQTFRIAGTDAYLHSNATETILQMDSGGWTLRYTRATGYLWYRRGGDGFNLFAVDGNGNVRVGRDLAADQHVIAANNLYARGGTVHFGGSDRSRLVSDNATFTGLFLIDAWRLQLNWADLSLHYYDGAGTSLMTVDSSGSLAVTGNLSANISVTAGAAVTAASGQMYMGNGGAGRLLQMSPNWFWDWNGGTGTLIWNRPGGYFWVMDATTSFCYNNMGPVGGVGGFITLSDERTKANIQRCAFGLESILQLNPITFNRIDSDKQEVGFSAQDVQRVIPQAVHQFPQHDLPTPETTTPGTSDAETPETTAPASIPPTLGVSLDPIVAALVMGMQELHARVQDLEEDRP